MGVLRTKQFWGDALERALSTSAQVVLAVYGADVTNIVETNFNALQLVTLAAFGFGWAILKAVAASQVGDKESASLVE